jgi:hypothetical protein
MDLGGGFWLAGLPEESIALFTVGKFLSLGRFRLWVPLLFNRDLARGSLPEGPKTGCLKIGAY